MDVKIFNEHRNEFEKAYFREITIKGIEIKNNLKREDEDKIIRYLNNGIINDTVVAWKAGRLIKEADILKPKMKDGDYLNGYGKKIKKNHLLDYLDEVSKNWKEHNLDKEEEFAKIYNTIIDAVQEIPDNFGCVYIINLIFFLSKGKWPIYDKFAHKAIKAIKMNKRPSEIYVGEAPSKAIVKDKCIEANPDVINMYSEYIWLLNDVFKEEIHKDKSVMFISRELDRALWVYGHASDKYDEYKI